MDFNGIKRNLLQPLCKELNVYVNYMTNLHMVSALNVFSKGKDLVTFLNCLSNNKVKRQLLQAFCKRHGIRANISNKEMVQRLTMLFEGNSEDTGGCAHGTTPSGAPTVNSDLAFAMDSMNVENESKNLKGLDTVGSVESECGVRTSQSALPLDCTNSSEPGSHKKRKASFASDHKKYRDDFLIEGDRGSTTWKSGRTGSKALTSNLLDSNEGSEPEDSDQRSIDRKELVQVDMEPEKSAVETFGELDLCRTIQRDTTQTPLDSSMANQFGYKVQAQCALAGGLKVNHIASNFDDSVLLDDRLLPDGLVAMDKLLNGGDLYCTNDDKNKPKELEIVDEDQDYQEDKENKGECEQKIDVGFEVQEPAGNEIETDSCFKIDTVELSRKKRKRSSTILESAVKGQPVGLAVSTIELAHLNENKFEEYVNFQGTCMEHNSVQPTVEAISVEDGIFNKSPMHSNYTADFMGDPLLSFNRKDTVQENTVLYPDKLSSVEVSSNLVGIEATEEANEGIDKSSDFNESAHPDLHKIDGQVVVDKYWNEANDSDESKKTLKAQMLPTVVEEIHQDIENGSNLVLTDGQVADDKFSNEIIVNAPEESKENSEQKSSNGDEFSITVAGIIVDELESGTMPVALETDDDCQNASSCGFSCGNMIDSATKDQPVSFAASTVDSHFELSRDISGDLNENQLEESLYLRTSMFQEELNAVQHIVSHMESVSVKDVISTYQPESEGQTSNLLDLKLQSETDSLIVESISQSGCVDDQSANVVIASVPNDHTSIEKILIVQVDMDCRMPAEAAAETVGEMQLTRTVPSNTTPTPLYSSPIKQAGNEVQFQCALAGGINKNVIGTSFDDIAPLESENTDGQVAEVKFSEITNVIEDIAEKCEDEFSCGDRDKVVDNKSVEEYHARIKATISEEANEGINKSPNIDEDAVDKYWNEGFVNAREESKEKFEAQMSPTVAEEVHEDFENCTNLVLTDGQVADDKFSNEVVVNAPEESKENSEHKSSITWADRIVDETESGTLPVYLEFEAYADGDCQNSPSCGFPCDNDEYDLGDLHCGKCDKKKLEEKEIVDENLEYEESKEGVQDVGKILDAMHDLSVEKNESSKDHSEELLNIQKGVSRQDVGETSDKQMDVNCIDNVKDPGNSKKIFAGCDQVGAAPNRRALEDITNK